MYRASQAGVSIDLIVRGMCCLRPGVKGVSDNIRVLSIIGRFLEHSRVYYFMNASPCVYCSSADLMERNLYRRVETGFPIERPAMVKRIINELHSYLEDSWQSWGLNANGDYKANREAPETAIQDVLLKNLAQ